MRSRRIREIEEEIEDLERRSRTCHEMDKDIIKRKIDNLKDELRRLKRKEEDEDDSDDDLLASMIGIGLGYHDISFGDSGGGGGFEGFGGGDSGGGGFGGDW